MLSHGLHFGKYGVQTTFFWFFEDVTATDAPFVGVAPVAADIFLSKDGGAPAAATNAMTAIGNGIYSHVLTAAEMSCLRLSVSVYDQTASEIYKPACMVILTKLQLGQVDIDSTAIGSNAPGVVILGHGTGAGIQTEGGATNPSYGIFTKAGAAGGAGIFAWGVAGNSSGLSALGAGSGSGFNAVGGASGIGLTCIGNGAGDGMRTTAGATGVGLHALGGATSGYGLVAEAQAGNSYGLYAKGFGTAYGIYGDHATSSDRYNNILLVTEGAEPTVAPVANETAMRNLQFLRRRFYNLVNQDGTNQKVYRDDSVTVVSTMAVAKAAGVQSKGKAT